MWRSLHVEPILPGLGPTHSRLNSVMIASLCSVAALLFCLAASVDFANARVIHHRLAMDVHNGARATNLASRATLPEAMLQEHRPWHAAWAPPQAMGPVISGFAKDHAIGNPSSVEIPSERHDTTLGLKATSLLVPLLAFLVGMSVGWYHRASRRRLMALGEGWAMMQYVGEGARRRDKVRPEDAWLAADELRKV